ncbi:MAG: hypothetical protein F4Y03_12630 [Alphaproteobacteria bacterium]|nr:hypothetical protein [Alphaproteobacteria bacterium]
MALRDDERRKARTITATDTEWQQIGAHAKRAGLPVSRFVVQRLTEPAGDTAVGAGMPRQAARDLRVLVKIEERRFREENASEAWEELVAEAEAEIDGEEALG